VHLERVPQHMRLVAPSLLQAFVLGSVKVVLQDGLVIGMGAFLDDEARTFAGRETPDVGQSLMIKIVSEMRYFGRGIRDKGRYLLGHNDVEVVLRLVDVCAHGHDAAHAGRVRLAGPGARGMHDADLRTAQEIG